MEQSKTEAQAQGKSGPATRKRSPLIYAVPGLLVVIVGVYLVLRPPSPGWFCSEGTGCYKVDFGFGQSEGTVAFSGKSGVFSLVRESPGVYTSSIGDEFIQLVIQDRNHLMRHDNAIFTRTPEDEVQRQLELAAKRAEEEQKAAEAKAKAQQAKIDSLLSQLARAQDEETRSKLATTLREEKSKQTKTEKNPSH